eukprot:scaffold36135_cov21-Tisochrysis_lutea.AAC.1
MVLRVWGRKRTPQEETSIFFSFCSFGLLLSSSLSSSSDVVVVAFGGEILFLSRWREQTKNKTPRGERRERLGEGSHEKKRV